MSMGEEYKMVKNSKGSLLNVVYYIARIAALGHTITATLFQTAIIPNCNHLLIALGICYDLSMTAASFLFYMRVRAIYYNNRLVQLLFGFLWISVFGTAITVPFALSGGHIGPTRYCIYSNVQSFVSASTIPSAVNDTLILFVISYKLIKNNNLNSSWTEMSRSLFKGEGFGSFSKAFMRDGFIYYLSTVSVNIVATVIVLTPSVPPVIRGMMGPPNIAVQSVMACRIYRKLKLGLIGQGDGSVSINSQHSVPLAWIPSRSRAVGMERSTGTIDGKGRPPSDDVYDPNVVSIKVTRDVELARDSDY